MKELATLVLLAVIAFACLKLARAFEEIEDAEIKANFINVLTEHGGAPTIIGYPPGEDGTLDSLLIYHTRIEISKEELKALNYLNKYYYIQLETE